MGYNIDLIKMFGHFKVACPHCGFTDNAENHGLEETDVDCSDYNPEPGVWVIERLYCNECEKRFTLKITITPTIQTEKGGD